MIDIRHVLCPTDFSPVSEHGVELAACVASRFGAQLTLQHNLDSVPPLYVASLEMLPQSVVELEEERERQAEARLGEILGTLPRNLAGRGRLSTGQAHGAILSLARSLPADLIVMGTHGRSGLGHLFIGSVTERVISNAPCPVLALRDSGQLAVFRALVGPDAAENHPVLVPVDFTSHSLYTLEYALRLLDVLPISLLLLHVVEPATPDDLRGATHFNVPEYLQIRLQEARQRLASVVPANVTGRIQTHVALGSAVEEIPKCAERVRARFLVMGSHRKGLLDEFLFGATSKGVLRTSPCPVWIVPALPVETHTARELEVPVSQ